MPSEVARLRRLLQQAEDERKNALAEYKYHDIAARQVATDVAKYARNLQELFKPLSEIQGVPDSTQLGVNQYAVTAKQKAEQLYAQLRQQYGDMCRDLADFEFDHSIGDAMADGAQTLVGMQQAAHSTEDTAAE